jgi:hypothetical protein
MEITWMSGISVSSRLKVCSLAAPVVDNVRYPASYADVRESRCAQPLQNVIVTFPRISRCPDESIIAIDDRSGSIPTWCPHRPRDGHRRRHRRHAADNREHHANRTPPRVRQLVGHEKADAKPERHSRCDDDSEGRQVQHYILHRISSTGEPA